jgi:hypothetical protein
MWAADVGDPADPGCPERPAPRFSNTFSGMSAAPRSPQRSAVVPQPPPQPATAVRALAGRRRRARAGPGEGGGQRPALQQHQPRPARAAGIADRARGRSMRGPDLPHRPRAPVAAGEPGDGPIVERNGERALRRVGVRDLPAQARSRPGARPPPGHPGTESLGVTGHRLAHSSRSRNATQDLQRRSDAVRHLAGRALTACSAHGGLLLRALETVSKGAYGRPGVHGRPDSTIAAPAERTNPAREGVRPRTETPDAGPL